MSLGDASKLLTMECFKQCTFSFGIYSCCGNLFGTIDVWKFVEDGCSLDMFATTCSIQNCMQM